MLKPRLKGGRRARKQRLRDVAHPVGKNKKGKDDFFLSGGSYLPVFTVSCEADRDTMVPLNKRI